MLIYETEGWIEVESEDIKQLCRSTAAVSFADTGSDAYAIQAVICDYLDDSEPCCRLALYVKTLKRSLIFAVKGPEKQSPWKHGQEVLSRLGFQLEEVNLRLSSAMQEVVLRDVPGLLSPSEARKQRTEKTLLLTELQNTYDKDPDTAQGKRASLKLGAAKRLNDSSEELRPFLERLFSQDEYARVDLEAFASQVKDLTSRLAAADALTEAERNQREMSESITTAAEKRIQELEEILVDVETKSSEALKQKRKAVQLRKQIKELGKELSTAETELEKEREKQEQFIADVKAAHERITLLEEELTEAEKSLENVQTQREEEQTERTRLGECLKESELRIETLDKELKISEEKAARCDNAVTASEDLQSQLAEEQQALQDMLELNNTLEEKLAASDRQSEELQKGLHGSEQRLEKTEQRLEESEQRQQEAEKNLQETGQRLEETGQRLEESEQRQQEAEKNLQETGQSLEETEQRLQEAEQRLQEAEQRLQEAEQHLQKTEQSLQETEQGLQETEQGLEDAEKAGRDKTGDKEQIAELIEQMAASTEQVVALTEQKEQSTGELKDLRDEYDQESALRKRLEKAAAKDDKRIKALERSLAKATQQTSTSTEDEKSSDGAAQEIKSLTIELQEQTQRLNDEQKLREGLDTELHESHKLIDSFEKMIRETEKADAERLSYEASKGNESQKVQKLEETLRSVENQLEAAYVEQKKLARAVTVAEKKLAKQEETLVQVQAERKERRLSEAAVVKETVTEKRVKSAKPLPHELRPTPKKGSLFYPDWDLEGLPCQSSEQVFKAWEPAFNVQISLEGYPSQYCMAFLVVLRLGKQKKLYMLYRLKKSKHTLVCVPAKPIKDEASLKKAIKEGLKFLMMSGFEMTEMAAENVDGALGSYFL